MYWVLSDNKDFVLNFLGTIGVEWLYIEMCLFSEMCND